MLKPAKEISKVSQSVKQRIFQEEQSIREKEREREQKIIAMEAMQRKEHAIFELRATDVAKNGNDNIVIADLKLSTFQLKSQGFLVKELTRRESFQRQLEELCQQKVNELNQLTSTLMYECPGLRLLDGDDFLHRDPLFSLMETLWRKGNINSAVDVELALAYIRTMTAVDARWLESNKKRFYSLTKLFSELKHAESKRNTITWENMQIPMPFEKALYISWEGSEDCNGMIVTFSSQKLKWLTKHWAENIDVISLTIDSESSKGLDSCVIELDLTDGIWNLIPSPDLYADFYVASCSPALLGQELTNMGYHVSLSSQSSVGDSEQAKRSVAPSTANFAAPTEPGGYQLTISWA